MALWHVRHPARTVGIAFVVVTLPLGITSCSLVSSEADTPFSNELRAASGADIFEVPDEQVYEVTSIEMAGDSVASSKLQAVADQTSNGSLVLSDGVITEATLQLDVAGHPNIEFALTEPVVLRRDGDGHVVNATGTLTVEDTVRYTARAAITPRFHSNEDSIEFDVRLDLPGTPLTLLPEGDGDDPSADAAESIEATVTLSAQ